MSLKQVWAAAQEGNSMDLMKYLSHITTVPGTSGYEAQAAQEFAKLFAPLCDTVTVNETQSMIGVQKGKENGPRVMLCAHIDEVGLMTTDVEEDGSVRFLSLGVAAQTLPAQEVTILAKDGPIYGVIGAVPPHLTGSGERNKVTPVEELFIDTGLSIEEVRRRVPAGTPVQLTGRTTELAGNHVASKTLDDRACAGILLMCAEELRKRVHDADVYYVLSAREERDSFGAQMAAEHIRPDLAVILDVTHGTMPGCAEGETYPLDATAISCGPNTHRKLAAHIKDCADKLNMKTVWDVAPGNTYTDAWEVQIACEGVPCVVLSLPIKYMHTTVELGSLELMRAQARLICEAVAHMDKGWEETLCF